MPLTYDDNLNEAIKAAKQGRIEIAVLQYTDDNSGEDTYGYGPTDRVRALFGPHVNLFGIVTADGVFVEAPNTLDSLKECLTYLDDMDEGRSGPGLRARAAILKEELK